MVEKKICEIKKKMSDIEAMSTEPKVAVKIDDEENVCLWNLEIFINLQRERLYF